MSVKVIRALLVADSAVLALVPVDRISAGDLPQGVALPALGVTEISTVEVAQIDAQSQYTLVESRIQVLIAAATYPAKKALLDAVRKAINYERGQIAGTPVVSIRRDSNGPDVSDPDAEFYAQTIDFKVLYHELN